MNVRGKALGSTGLLWVIPVPMTVQMSQTVQTVNKSTLRSLSHSHSQCWALEWTTQY